jgi:ribonuclease P protein component
MLPRKQRLTKDKDVTRVLRKGRAVFTNLIKVRAAEGQYKSSRATVIVGLKVNKRSTKRNLIKRRLRASLQKFFPDFKAVVDLVVVAEPESVGRSQKDLSAALEYCLKKLGVI